MTRRFFFSLVAAAATPEPRAGIIDMKGAPALLDVFEQPSATSARRRIDWKKDAAVTEHGYDEEGLLVHEQSGEWFRIKMLKGSAWTRLPKGAKFLELGQLFEGVLTYLTKDWDGRLAKSAGGALGAKLRIEPEPTIRVVGNQKIGGQLWISVQVLNASPCEEATPRVIARGWVPAQFVWFYSRGC